MAKPEDAIQSMINSLEEKTGHSLDEWRKIIKKSGLQKHGEIVAMLKKEHGVTHGYANQIALQVLKSGPAAAGAKDAKGDGGEDDAVAAQYAGAKAALRPIYDKLAKEVAKFGSDVDFSPKKAYVSLRRKKQFGIIQPSTATRVDVGLNLPGAPPKGRLEASGSFNAMVTHRVRVESVKDVDKELLGWLHQAYEQA